MPHVCSLVLCLLAAETALAAQEKTHVLPPPEIKMAKEGVSLPLSFVGGRPVVEAMVNGKGPYRFYFDTGASGPVVSKQLTKELGLKGSAEIGVSSGGDGPKSKPIPGELVQFQRVELGGAQIANLHIVAMDMGRIGNEDAPVGVLS